MPQSKKSPVSPEILAPAGNRASFLAAISAGADAVYCGLKDFSARMAAKNFHTGELENLVGLAHEEGTAVYIAFNSLIRPGELNPAAGMIRSLARRVKPDGIIFQDPALVEIARQVGYSGELHLSTLANASFPAALPAIRSSLGIDRVVLPRELNIDEIRSAASACPSDLGLEVFVHGALCYGVSGRCYWSSFLGGKSGLRGRCVQPCRRVYSRQKSSGRLFSCQDFSLDVLAKVLLTIPQIKAWKIEGRKKGPHYVYYTVSAYKMLRDEGGDPDAKRAAVQLLERSLGRTGTHYFFLPQRPQNPIRSDRQTGSGLFVGAVKGPVNGRFLSPREPLLTGDVLRIGYEDDAWHSVYRIKKNIPRGGRFYLSSVRGRPPGKGVPVFLTDRREPELHRMIQALESRLPADLKDDETSMTFRLKMPAPVRPVPKVQDMVVFRNRQKGGESKGRGYWISEAVAGSMPAMANGWWWLPPVLWPDGQDALKTMLDRIVKNGGRQFVLNAPWQVGLFEKKASLHLWAGPFCNIANAMAVEAMRKSGFSGVIVSPELTEKDYLQLAATSSLPLGIVIQGLWPLTISRALSEEVEPDAPFFSPKKEKAWVCRQPDHCFWVYPDWQLDLEPKKSLLKKAGYRVFVYLKDPVAAGVTLKNRSGLWNWDGQLA